MLKWVLLAALVSGCAHHRAVGVVRDRIVKLQPLSNYSGTQCEVVARPTQRALARFSQMHPGEVERLHSEAWMFKWRQTESRCQVTPAASAASPVVKAQLGFVEAALCMLAQVFYVNSPFDELQYGPDEVQIRENWVQLGPQKSDTGLFLDRNDFNVVTRTRTRGEYAAHYKQFDGEWLPDRMEHKPENLMILVDQIKYGDRLGSRRIFESMMVSVGTERPLAHSELIVRNCQPL